MVFNCKKIIKRAVLALTVAISASCQVFAYEAPTAIDQLRIDTYLMLRHLPEKIKNPGVSSRNQLCLATVLDFAVPDLGASFDEDIDGKLSHRNRNQEVSPDIAVEAAFRALDLVLFGKQSKSKVFQSNSNFVINDQEWGFQDASEEDIDNGIPLLIAYALNLASVTIESYSDHKAENKARFKKKIDDAKDMMQATKDKDYKEHLDVALGVIKAELLYRKWRKDVIKEATKGRQANKDANKWTLTHLDEEWPDGKLYDIPDEKKAHSKLLTPIWKKAVRGKVSQSGGMTTHTKVYYELKEGAFANVKWSDVDWEEDDYAYGLFENYSDGSLVKDRLSNTIFHPKKNQRKDFEERTDSEHKLMFNIECLVNQGLTIEEYDKRSQFNSFLVPRNITRYDDEDFYYTSLDMDFLNYIYMSYVNLYSVLELDYKKHNTGKFRFIPRLYYGSKLLDFLIVGSKLYHNSDSAKKFIDSFDLTEEDEDELDSYFTQLTINRYLKYELYCYKTQDEDRPLEYAHISNKILPEYTTDRDVVKDTLNIGVITEYDSERRVSEIGSFLPQYFSTDLSNYYSDLSLDYDGEYYVPPIEYYTGILNGPIYGGISDSVSIYINARELGEEVSIPADGGLNFIRLYVEEINEKDIESFLPKVFEAFRENRQNYQKNVPEEERAGENRFTFQLTGKDILKKYSIDEVRKLAEGYDDFVDNIEEIDNGYEFSIGDFEDEEVDMGEGDYEFYMSD